MGSFQNPVGGRPHDPYESYRVEAIERDRMAKENPPPPFPPKEPKGGLLALLAHILSFFQKALENLLGTSAEPKTEPAAEQAVIENLLLLKACFQTLKIEDRSQDVEFLQRLHEVWQQVLIDALRFPKASPLAKHFRALIDRLQGYPENQEHTFGYYLSEYAGQDWLPFPYMEMIRKMHAEHLASSSSSPLAEWTRLLDQLLSRLRALKTTAK